MTDATPHVPGNTLACASSNPNRRTSRTAFAAEPPDPDDPLLGFAPYEHRQPRRNAITPDRQRAFIAALAATGIVTQAAREIGASLEALYKLRNRPGAEGFAAAWEAAVDRGVARLEDCVLERAMAGEERIVVRGGEVVATWRHYNTALALFLLRQRRAQRFETGGAHFANLREGHPVYDRLKRQWELERAIATEADSDRIVQDINLTLERMRDRSIEDFEVETLPGGGYRYIPEEERAARRAVREAVDRQAAGEEMDRSACTEPKIHLF